MQFEASLAEWVFLIISLVIWKGTTVLTQPGGTAILKEFAALLTKCRGHSGPEQIHPRR